MKTQKMPSLFIGHGSPMNVIMDNSFTQHLRKLGQTYKPKKILIISAHWVTAGTQVHAHVNPKTIYDFYGFPNELYQIKYPAPGDPMLANELRMIAQLDHDWGFDHGTWSILHHMYPNADIPVVQLSLNHSLTLKEHFQLAKELQKLREEGVMIIGSGNIVHNLRAYDRSVNAPTPDWSQEFDDYVTKALANNHQELHDLKNEKLFRMAHPSTEHYLPLLYTVGASTNSDSLTFPHTGFEGGSLSMRSVLFNPI